MADPWPGAHEWQKKTEIQNKFIYLRQKNLPKPRYIQWHALLELSANTFTARLLIIEIFTIFPWFAKKILRLTKKYPQKIYFTSEIIRKKSEVESCCSHLFETLHSFRNKTMKWKTKRYGIKKGQLERTVWRYSTEKSIYNSTQEHRDVIIKSDTDYWTNVFYLVHVVH